MEAVRYKPGEAVRWMESGADRIRSESKRKAQSVFRREGARSVGRDVTETVGALFDAGAAALAELRHRQAEAAQYLLEDEGFTVISMTGSKKVRYDEVANIRLDGDHCLIELERGSVSIRPFAHIVAGRVKVPVGWARNGVEVPFELLIEELAARAGLDVVLT